MGITLGTKLFTWLRGELVGTDQFGNRYYRDKRRPPLKRGGGRESREKRWKSISISSCRTPGPSFQICTSIRSAC